MNANHLLMTEKERMLSGQPYDSRDPELLGRYHEVRKLLSQFGSIPSDDQERKGIILASLLGSHGDNVWIEAPFFCDYGEQIRIGSNVFINYNCVFLDSNEVIISDNVLVGPAVHIYTTSHPVHAKDRIQTGEANGRKKTSYLTQSKPVKIGRNAWIGGGALLMPGITIGRNTTIGAGSVVTTSIPSDCFAAGNPCRVIKQL